jgi:AcrR family transcriptional regulator
MTDGRRTRGEATRERLLSVARRLFGEQGFDGTSIEEILAGAGVARGALYHHFSSKTALFEAVVEGLCVEIAQQTQAAADERSSSLERLQAGSHAWLVMALDPAVARIALLDPPAVLGWSRWRELDEKHSLGGLRAAFRGLARERRIPPAQAELMAHMLLAALNEAALFIAGAQDERAALATASAGVDLLIERLAGEGSSASRAGRARARASTV